MPRSDNTTGAMHKLVVLLAAARSRLQSSSHLRCRGGARGVVDSFSYPAFDATTAQDLVAGINNSVLTPASHLFDHDGAFAVLNRTEGVLLLSRTVDVWHTGPGGAPALEASFNTSFELSGAAPVAFVVLQSYLPLGVTGGLRGLNNVRVTPNGTATRAVWIEYDAAAHRLSVYVAGAGEAAFLEKRLSLAGQRTAEKAMVGFFASTIQDILVGVRDWNLTVDRFDSSGGDGRKKGTSWWVILLAVLGSVAATASA